MAVIDLITWVNAICKKYEKYDIDKQKEANVTADDAFVRLYGVVESELDAALQESEASATEKELGYGGCYEWGNSKNKARLLEELPKKKVKGLSREDLEARKRFGFFTER